MFLDRLAGTGSRPHGRRSRLGIGGHDQPGFEGETMINVEGLELPGPSALQEVDPDPPCGCGPLAAGGETVANESELRTSSAPRRRPRGKPPPGACAPTLRRRLYLHLWPARRASLPPRRRPALLDAAFYPITPSSPWRFPLHDGGVF